ncbi:MAG TPA: SDR family NAD(P)-dependent oxidoreductase [Flavobacteriales bacterium]|nr:SDR family NAD(P)-dependent oxidoreductase [Flavobacteriales bacterium]
MTSPAKGYALITGASQGIGAAVALELARKGFGVVVTARSEDALRQVCAAAAALNNGHARAIAVDLSAPDGVDRIVRSVSEQGLPLSCLVNNAGQGLWGMFDELTLDDQRRMMHLNMTVPVALTHQLLPLLRKAPEAYILNVASMVAHHALGSMAVYSGSKAFVLRWSRSLRIELKGTNIRVTCCSPGSVITGFTQRAGMQAMDDLARKFGTGPEPVAKAAVAALLHGKAEVIPGLMNVVASKLQGLLPTGLSESIASGIYLKRLRSRK